MAKEVAVNLATVSCTAGASTAVLSIASSKARAQIQNVAVVSDKAFIPTPAIFVTCSILSGACVPALVGNWSPGCIKLNLSGTPCARLDDTLTCSVGGTLSIDNAGQTKVKAE